MAKLDTEPRLLLTDQLNFLYDNNYIWLPRSQKLSVVASLDPVRTVTTPAGTTINELTVRYHIHKYIKMKP